MDNYLVKLKKASLPIAVLGMLGLGGCVAYPAYGPDPYYAPAPAPVVVRPAVSFGYYGYYGGGRGYYGGHRHWR
jgi:hypothetical protein